MKKHIFTIFVTSTLLIVSNQLAFSQVPNTSSLSNKDLKRIAKVKKDLDKIGVGNTITVSRLDDRDFFGRVKKIGSADFEITETDSKQVQIFRYEDIKNVRKGDGAIGMRGTRTNSRRKWIVFGAVIVGLVVLLPVIGLAGDSDH